MTDGISLGSATLGLEASLVQLRADLDDALARVTAKTAEMQRVLDTLHVGVEGGLLGATLDTHGGAIGLWAAAQDAEMASVRRSAAETEAAYASMAAGAQVAADLQVAASGRVVEAYAAQAAAAKATADAEEAAAGRSALARSILGGIGGHGVARDVAAASAIWGVRGPTPPPGSITNPIVFVQEAASRTPLGSLAAAVGEDAQGGGPEAVTVSTQRGSTTTVVGTTPAAAEQARQRGAIPTIIGLDAQRQQVMEDSLARALTALEAAQKPSDASKVTTISGITQEDQKVAQATGSAIADALAADTAAKAATPSHVAPGQFASAALADLYAAKGLQAALGPDMRLRVYGEGGVPGTHTFGVLPGAAVGGAGGPGGAGGSGGGGGWPPWLTALLWGHGGGGGGGGGYYGGGVAGRALVGAAGIGAGIGSLGSFAGFGPEHIILTLGGIAGSGVAALGGGALLGAGALGKFAAGAGSDALVGGSAIADTKTLYTAYEKLREAVAQYGKGSEQADEAQKELNATMQNTLSGTPGVTAELHLAEKLSALNVQWDKQTSTARVAFVKLAEPLIEIASKWIPLINTAATQNFDAMSKALQPFFAYLKGPEAMGIFLQLESEFKNEIPTAMAALDQGFQLFGKTVAYTAPLTGGFLKDLDKFFTKWNTPSEFSVWEGEMNKLITDFDVWKAFLKELGGALVDLFDKDAHTGETIIETLTEMLHKVREYENSTAGGAAIRNIFTVHKEEVIALLGALVPLISSFSHIYTTVSPPLVAAVTNIAEAFTKVLTTIEKAGPLGTWAIGLTLIAAKLKVLSPLLAALKTELFGVAAAEGEAAAGATALAEGETAAGAGAVAEGGGVAGDAAGLGGLASKSLLLKGGLAGFVGLLGGSALAGAVGAKGTLGTSISAAGAGAGLGFVAAPAADAILGTTVGGPIGAAIGAMIGFGTPYLIKGIGDLFKSGEPAFQKEARRTAAAVTSYPGLLGPGQHPHETTISKALEEAHTIGLHTTENRGTTAAMVAPNRALEAKAFAKAGTEAGEEFRNAFQHVRFTGNQYLGFLETAKQTLEKFPAQARGTAAKAMLAYATELEAKGSLPKGSVAHVITDLEGQFKEITPFLQREGAGQSSALQKAWRLTNAQATLKNSLIKVEQQFGGTWADTTSGAQSALHFLNEIIHSNADPMEKAMAAMLEKGINKPLGVIWRQAQEVNSRELAKINSEFSSELKALGVEGIKTFAITQGGGVAKTPFTPIPGEGALAPGHAQGGLLQIGQPGEAGHDTVGLNVGGLPIAVGPGEQVAVFNRHQQPIVNAALEHMGYGGLPGLFGAVTTPNYMAAGGLIPDVVQAGLRDVRGDAKAKLAHMSSIAGAHGGGGAPSGASHASMPYLEHLWIQAGGPPGVAHLMAAIAMAESGGDPAALNASGACVPLSTPILTRRGWLAHDEVQIGDETLGYNPASERSEWTRITAVVRYEDQEVWRVGNKNWKAEVTPGHRWWSDTRVKRPPGTPDDHRGEFIRTQDLNCHHRLRVAAVAATGDGVPHLSRTECAIIGWLMGDGHVRKARGQRMTVPSRRDAQGRRTGVHRGQREWTDEDKGWDACIYQAKEPQVQRIRRLLRHLPHSEKIRNRGANRMDEHAFQLRRSVGTELLTRARWQEITTDPESFVLALSPAQRRAWLDAVIDAEGSRVQPAEHHRPFVRIAQVDGPLQEAIKLAVYLEGHQPSESRLSRHSEKHAPAANIGMCNPHVAATAFQAPEVLERQPVWCVTTELGTWTMRQNGLPCLTGNSGLWQILGLPFPGNPFNPLENAKMAVAKYTSQGLGAWVTYTSGAYRAFYAKGGLLGLASGGLVPPHITAKFPQRTTAGKIPKGIRAHTFGKIPPVNTSWSGQGAWGALNSLMSPSGEVAKLIERYGLEETAGELALSKAPHSGAFVITPSALEKAAGITTPFEDVGNVELRSGQLAGLSGTEQDLLNELTQAWNWSQQVLSSASVAVKERNQAISELRARIKANLKKIQELRAAIKRQEAALAKIPTGKHATAADKAHAAKLRQEIANEQGEIRSLEIENRNLGGETTGVGTGGNIGALLAENTELSNAKASTEGWVTEIGGATGAGGKRQEAHTTIAKLEQQMIELGQTPERLREALLESGSGPESALELSERKLAQTEEKLKISKQETLINQQALSVFGGPGDLGLGGINAYAAAGARGMLIPASWIPSMDVGGIVPGAKGAPSLILAHGQEQVLTPEEREQRGGMHQHTHWEINTLHPADPDTLLAIGKASTRGQRLQGNRLAKRLVPGV